MDDLKKGFHDFPSYVRKETCPMIEPRLSTNIAKTCPFLLELNHTRQPSYKIKQGVFFVQQKAKEIRINNILQVDSAMFTTRMQKIPANVINVI